MVPPRSDRISRVPPYSRIYTKITCTGLSPTMACLSRQFQFFNIDHWPGPRSLAATNGVSVDVLSSGYLDVSVHQVRFSTLYIQIEILPKGVGFPIRISSDQSLLATPRSFSQHATSFIASMRQGIHQMPLKRLISALSSHTVICLASIAGRNIRSFRLSSHKRRAAVAASESKAFCY